ncbi:MAG: protein kinase [Bryobacteraceae bacterium]
MPEGLTSSEGGELLSPGDLFAGRYKVLNRIGAGGSSQVLRVEDTLAGQVIAIKILRRGLANDPSTIAQFRREVAIARQLIHPHVVRIYDIGEHEGLLYIVMEYVDGRSFSDMLADRGRFALADLLPLIAQFAEAVGFVHSHGVLHRDIKPNNILVDRHGMVKLMDFGIARIFHGSGSMGTIVGTPAYMAPEQMAGEPVSQATDVFAAGAMIYELLTGKRPFKGLGVMARMKEKPAPAHTIVPELTEGVSEALARAMEFRPADRHQSINQLVSDLRQNAPRSVVRPTREVTIAEFNVPDEEPAPAKSGRSLADLVSADPPELTSALRLLRRVFERAAAVHAAGQHAVDLAPSRVGIGEDGSIRIEAEGETSAATSTMAVSDPKYSAPESFTEQGLQTAEDRKRRDVYVLGTVALEMLAGRDRFGKQFEREAAEAPMGWMRWHLDPASPAPALSVMRDDVPAALGPALGAMLEKDPTRRPAGFAPVLEAIDAALLRLEATQPQTIRTREFVLPAPADVAPGKSRRWLLAPLAILPLAAAAGAAWWFLPAWRTPAPPPEPPPLTKTQPPPKKDEGKAAATPQDRQDQHRRELMPVDPQLPKSLFFPAGDMILIAPSSDGPTAPYYLDRYEVTNAAYLEFCRATKRRPPAAPDWDADYLKKDNYPVLNVRWDDAAAFAKWAGKRLPTEREWEHAASGIERLRFPWGNGQETNGANLAGVADGHGFASPVGAMFYDLGPFGVADMLGNASEWVADGAPEGFHLMKGSNFTVEAASASLDRKAPAPDKNTNEWLPVGIRCAKDAAQ